MQSNLILDTDSYKASHWLQYPPGTTQVYAYIEARASHVDGVDATLFFGLQAFLKTYLSRPVGADDLAEARELFAAHGEPFNLDGWQHILDRHGGWLPVEIRAVPEGSRVPLRQALVTIENTDPAVPWLTSYLETALLRAIWYPTTVATISRTAKETLRAALERTSDDPAASLAFKLHDFGARGVSSAESARLGGMAHLVNFMGTDTVEAIRAIRACYGPADGMPAFSVPAAEHSTMTMWGEAGELDAYRNMVRRFGRPGAIYSVVSDSWSLARAVDEHWGRTLRDEVLAAGGTLVVRLDSGDPIDSIRYALESLGHSFGFSINGKGYRVLDNVRLLQGDGIDLSSLAHLCTAIADAGWSLDCFGTFGMGGALLQKVNRDTFSFAQKASWGVVNGEARAICKRPQGDPGKASKAGRIASHRHRGDGRWCTAIEGTLDAGEWQPMLEPVWRDGKLLREQDFADVRARAEAGFGRSAFP